MQIGNHRQQIGFDHLQNDNADIWENELSVNEASVLHRLVHYSGLVANRRDYLLTRRLSPRWLSPGTVGTNAPLQKKKIPAAGE